jgi:hypothetical protein
MFNNSQIVHQMPFGHVVTTNQHPSGIQLQHHHPGEFKVAKINYLIKINENIFIVGSQCTSTCFRYVLLNK